MANRNECFYSVKALNNSEYEVKTALTTSLDIISTAFGGLNIEPNAFSKTQEIIYFAEYSNKSVLYITTKEKNPIFKEVKMFYLNNFISHNCLNNVIRVEGLLSKINYNSHYWDCFGIIVPEEVYASVVLENTIRS